MYIIKKDNRSIETFLGEPKAVLSRQWFATYTSSCHEKRVSQHLAIREIEHFLPVTRIPRSWKNGLKVILERPLFPGYVFVKIDPRERLRVLSLPGVHSIVGVGSEPIALPGTEIEALRESIGLMNAEPHPFLMVGNKAKIVRGPLQGLTGIIVRRKNGLRFVISLELIMKSISVEIEAADLELLEAA